MSFIISPKHSDGHYGKLKTTIWSLSSSRSFLWTQCFKCLQPHHRARSLLTVLRPEVPFSRTKDSHSFVPHVATLFMSSPIQMRGNIYGNLGTPSSGVDCNFILTCVAEFALLFSEVTEGSLSVALDLTHFGFDF